MKVKMVETNERIRNAARVVVRSFVNHIKHQVDAGNPLYIQERLDTSVEHYEQLYKYAIGSSLGIEVTSKVAYPKDLLKDLTSVVTNAMKENGLKGLMKNPFYKSCIYDLCLLVFTKFKEHGETELEGVSAHEQ